MYSGYRPGIKHANTGQSSRWEEHGGPGQRLSSHQSLEDTLLGGLWRGAAPGAPGAGRAMQFYIAPRDRRRGRAEIIYNILGILAHEGRARKNRIMQLANLNSRAFEEHVERYLVALGFVAKRRLRRGVVVYELRALGRQLYALLEAARGLGVFDESGASEEEQRLLNEALEAIQGEGATVIDASPRMGFVEARLPCPEGGSVSVVVVARGGVLGRVHAGLAAARGAALVLVRGLGGQGAHAPRFAALRSGEARQALREGLRSVCSAAREEQPQLLL